MTELTVEMLDEIDRRADKFIQYEDRPSILFGGLIPRKRPRVTLEAKDYDVILAAARKGLDAGQKWQKIPSECDHPHWRCPFCGTRSASKDSAKPLAARTVGPHGRPLIYDSKRGCIDEAPADADEIVKRLRACNGRVVVGPLDWLNDAADIIERQAAEIEFWKGSAEKQCEAQALTHEQLVKAQAEIERLRKALVEIAAAEQCYPDVMQHIARSSLSARQEPQSDDPAKS